MPELREIKSAKATAIATKREQFETILKSNLDFKKPKTKKDPRHTWHSFPAKFPPQLPDLFITNLTEKDEVVLDPMMGSCTSLLEATAFGRKAYGFDIDPLALLLGKAKLQNIVPQMAEHYGKQIIANAKRRFAQEKSDLTSQLTKRFDKETLAFIDFWYFKDTQLELLALLEQIESVRDEPQKLFFQLVFSAIIITKNGGVTRAMDLAHTRPHRVENKIPNSAFDEFAKRLKKNLRNYQDHPFTETIIEKANAKKLPIENETIDLIVTSPPYANNAIDYMRAHKFSLVWFGYKIADLKATRRKYIGSETTTEMQFGELPDLSNEKIIELSKLHPKKGEALHRYYSEMHDVIQEMHRVLKPETACAIVIATSNLNGLDVETHNCLAEIGETIGFKLVHIGERHIDRNKRMLPASMNGSNSQIEARMHTEYVLGFWKP